MPTVLPPARIDDLVEAYRSGMGVNNAAQRVGVSVGTADKYLRERGVPKRTKAQAARLAGAKRKGRERPYLRKPMPPQVIELYRSGLSLRDIGARFGKCRKKIAAYLRAQGVTLDRATTIRRKYGAGAQRAWAAKAAAVAATKPIDRVARAKARAAGRGQGGAQELEFCRELHRRGVEVFHQRPIHAYNVDIAVEETRLAVEIQRCSWHGASSARRERLECLFDRGWRVVFVMISRHGAATDFAAVTDQLVALHERARRDPATPGQYGVLRRNGKAATRVPTHFHDFTRIPGF